MIKKILQTLIRPKLEYAALIWSPSTKKNIKKLERIQRATTKLIPTLANLTYEQRLAELELLTLEQRREQGDLITIYRIMKGKECLDREDLLKMDRGKTRGHAMKLKKDNYRRDLKKNSFPHRVIDICNKLDEEIVCANTIQQFKNKLDLARYKNGSPQA